jgi:hypothetical protein
MRLIENVSRDGQTTSGAWEVRGSIHAPLTCARGIGIPPVSGASKKLSKEALAKDDAMLLSDAYILHTVLLLISRKLHAVAMFLEMI